MTYDEDFARASPGVQVTLDLNRALLDEPGLKHLDSNAKADHPSMNRAMDAGTRRQPMVPERAALSPACIR